ENYIAEKPFTDRFVQQSRCKLEIGSPINIDGKSCLNKIQQYLATPLFQMISIISLKLNRYLN
ncbi:hypothetical protein ACVXO9_16255, partial [Acinetobacter baumannii]